MDITENGLLLATAIIGGVISVALTYVINCAKRQSVSNRKVLKKKWLSNDFQNPRLFCNNDAEKYTLPQRHRCLNPSWSNLGQTKNFSIAKEMNRIAENSLTELSPNFSSYVTDFNVTKDRLDEQTSITEIGATNTQMTSTLTSVESCGNLDPNLKTNYKISKSNDIVEIHTDNKDTGNNESLELNTDNKSVSKEKSWNNEQDCPQYYRDENLQKSNKYKNCAKKKLENAIMGEYKLSKSVAELVQKYEDKSRVESDQDTYNNNIQKNKRTTLST